MCRHPTAVEQAGGAEQEGAGADRGETAGLRCRGAKPAGHLLGSPGARFTAARHHPLLDRQRQFGLRATGEEADTGPGRHWPGGGALGDDIINLLIA